MDIEEEYAKNSVFNSSGKLRDRPDWYKESPLLYSYHWLIGSKSERQIWRRILLRGERLYPYAFSIKPRTLFIAISRLSTPTFCWSRDKYRWIPICLRAVLIQFRVELLVPFIIPQFFFDFFRTRRLRARHYEIGKERKRNDYSLE